jgi:hypothetical protein
MAEAGSIIALLKQQIGELTVQLAITQVELAETQARLHAALAGPVEDHEQRQD